MTSARNCEDIELSQNTFLNKLLHDTSSSSIQVFSNNTALGMSCRDADLI